jgi:hypothetical protein
MMNFFGFNQNKDKDKLMSGQQEKGEQYQTRKENEFA